MRFVYCVRDDVPASKLEAFLNDAGKHWEVFSVDAMGTGFTVVLRRLYTGDDPEQEFQRLGLSYSSGVYGGDYATH